MLKKYAKIFCLCLHDDCGVSFINTYTIHIHSAKMQLVCSRLRDVHINSSNLKKRTLLWVLRHIPSKTNLFLLRICLKTHGKVRFLELELN